MFLTIAYIVAFTSKKIHRQCRIMFYLRMINKYMSEASIVLDRTVKSTSDFCSLSCQSSSRFITHCNSNFQLSFIEPQVALSLDDWCHLSIPQDNYISFQMRLVHCTVGNHSNRKLINHLYHAVAVKKDEPQCVLAQSSYLNFLSLMFKYMSELQLFVDQLQQVDSITTVRVIDRVNLIDGLNLTKNEVDRSSMNESPQNKSQLSSSSSSSKSSCEHRKLMDANSLEKQASEEISKTSNNGRHRLPPNKPLNVLVYCGKKDSTRLFENIKSVICECINTSCYTVYPLKHEQVQTTPWSSNTALLVIASDKVYDGVDENFLDYFVRGGALLSFGSSFDWLLVQRKDRAPDVKGLGVLKMLCSAAGDEELAAICTRYSYDLAKTLLPKLNVTSIATERISGESVIVEAQFDGGDGIAVLSQVTLDKDPVEMAISNEVFRILKRSNALRFKVLTSLFARVGLDCSKSEVLALSAVHLLAKSQAKKLSFLQSVEPRLTGDDLVSKELTLQFVRGEGYKSLPVSPTQIPVVTDSEASTQNATGFDFVRYCQHHRASVLGNIVLFADVITTTMTLFDNLMFSCPDDVGLVAVARRQVAGQGRGGNTWLGPNGCAMFSVHVRVPLSSKLGERVTFIQHLMGLSAVLGVRRKPGCENVDLRIKWPNDIYFGRDVKLGGVIVKSTVMDNVIHVNIGCGVNVANKDPTSCINDLISRVSSVPQPECFTVEEFIARTLNELEMLIEEFQLRGRDSFLEKYYKYWLHSDTTVRLGSESGPEATVVGLDDYGFLLVRLTTDGSTVSVQPDGNSFDMMKNLILPKNT